MGEDNIQISVESEEEIYIKKPAKKKSKKKEILKKGKA